MSEREHTWIADLTDDQVTSGKPPTFLVIGAAKTGSSALYHYLRRDPRVSMSNPKEPNFFAMDARYAAGLDRYCALWADARSDQQRGEMSTRYSVRDQFPLTAERIARALPEVCLVYLVRDPVQRTRSHYVWRMRYGVTMTFEEAIEKMPDIVQTSHYAYQLDAYRRHFGREKLLVLDTVGLRDDADGFVGEIQDFLGLDRRAVSDEGPIVSNVSTRRQRGLVMADLRRRLPGLAAVGRITPTPVRDRLYRILTRTRRGLALEDAHVPPPPRRETLEMLAERFRPDAERLSTEYGVDVSAWSTHRAVHDAEDPVRTPGT